MKTTIETSEGKVLVTLEGKLDSIVSEEVGEKFEPLYDVENTEITLDCTKLEYIASSGLRLFFLIARNALPNGNKLYIKGANPMLMNVFQSTGFDGFFEFI